MVLEGNDTIKVHLQNAVPDLLAATVLQSFLPAILKWLLSFG